MYYVCKRLEISAAHSLMLSYESKCEDLHGHNWIVKIYCKDHKFLNEVLPMNPTAENIARWICDRTPNAYKVEVWESEMNMAAYERD